MWRNGLAEAYEVFGCGRDITYNEVKSIYRALAKKYHPDAYKGKDGAEMIKKINYAYEIILDNIEVKDFTVFEYVKEEKENKKRQNEYMGFKNEKAYKKRKISGNRDIEEDFYCWDPEFESFLDFTISIGDISAAIITKIFQKYYDFPYGAGPTCFFDILCSKESQILFSLLRSEFIRPYYCLCKLTKRLISGEIETRAFWPRLIGRGGAEYCEWNVSLSLRGTSYEGRTENIERCKEGEEVILVGFGDNPLYPEKIEVLDMHYNSLGTIPAEFAVCITPLVQNGILDVDGVIENIKTRKMRGARCRMATIDVKLSLSIKNKDFFDWPLSKKASIDKIINKCEKKCIEIARYYSRRRDIQDYMVAQFSKNVSVIVKKGTVKIPAGYKECLAHILGTFGQFDRYEKYDKRMLGTFNLTKLEVNGKFNAIDEELWINSIITMTTKDIYEGVRAKLGDVFYCETGNLLYVFETSWTRDIQDICLKIFSKDLYIE